MADTYRLVDGKVIVKNDSDIIVIGDTGNPKWLEYDGWVKSGNLPLPRRIFPSEIMPPQIDITLSVNGKTGVVALSPADVGAIAVSEKGASNGIAPLVSGVVPTTMLPAPPVTSINNKTGVVVINSADVGAIALAEKGLSVATLVGGIIPADQMPPIAITDTFVINTQAAMLALTAQPGDVAVRTDILKTFILKSAPSSNIANWQELPTPIDTILSVNGKTGVVVLNFADVGAIAASEKGALNGIAALANGTVPTNQLPLISISGGGTNATDAPNARINLGISSQTWTNLTLLNAWTNTSGTARISKLTNGKVIFEGLLSRTTAPTSGQAIATLPTGFRPLQNLRFTSSNSVNNSRPTIEINAATGQVSYFDTGTIPATQTNLTLCSISFYAL